MADTRAAGPDPAATGKGPAALRAIAVAGVALLLAWFVGAQGLARLAALGISTELLSRFDPGTYPTAGTRLAQVRLQLGQAGQAAAIARPAALASPMNVRPVRTLGLALDALNDKPAATRIMRVAERLSWRDTQTSVWVLRDAAINRDIPRILNQVDALARRQVQSEATSRIFYAGLEDAPSRQAFAELLGRNPPWRSNFFANIRVNLQPKSFGQMEQLLDRLDRTKAPATRKERMTFIDRMTDYDEGRQARAYWLRSFGVASAAGAQVPYDPRFRAIAARRPDAAVSPFEWGINPDTGQFVELRQTDRGPMVDVAPGAADGTGLMSQVLTLAPGTHRIETVVEGPTGQAPAGWQLTCLRSGTPLIRTFARPGDELSGVAVDVPNAGCATQRLALTANGRMNARSVGIRQVVVR